MLVVFCVLRYQPGKTLVEVYRCVYKVRSRLLACKNMELIQTRSSSRDRWVRLNFLDLFAEKYFKMQACMIELPFLFFGSMENSLNVVSVLLVLHFKMCPLSWTLPQEVKSAAEALPAIWLFPTTFLINIVVTASTIRVKSNSGQSCRICRCVWQFGDMVLASLHPPAGRTPVNEAELVLSMGRIASAEVGSHLLAFLSSCTPAEGLLQMILPQVQRCSSKGFRNSCYCSAYEPDGWFTVVLLFMS